VTYSVVPESQERMPASKADIQYINNYRLSQAKDLLFRQPHLAVKEIAEELGFENPHYFTRLFKAIYGETPSRYRQRTVNYVEAEHPKVR